jgi:hypothetical protein
MQRVSARLLLAAALLASFGSQSAASDDEEDLLSSDSILSPGWIIRGQGPAPPQMRVAQGMMPQPDPYDSPTPVYTTGPNGAVCLPPMDPYSACPPPVSCPWQPFHFGVFGEFIYLHPRNNDVQFAVPQDGIVALGSVPTGPVGVADPIYSPGFRAGGFFSLGPDSRVIGTYTWFHSTTDTTIDATAPSVINPLVLFPGTFNAGFTAQQASSGYEIDFQIIDIDYQVVYECCQNYWWGYSGGARLTRLTQDFNATFPFGPNDGTTTLNTSASFEGVGPRAGLEGERALFPCCGLRAYGKGSASFLVGNFKTTYDQENQFGGTQALTSLKQDRIVPILDFELGLAWIGPREHVRISGGYLVSAWFNTITTRGWINSVQDGNFQPGSDTITFDGLTARAEVRF